MLMLYWNSEAYENIGKCQRYCPCNQLFYNKKKTNSYHLKTNTLN